ncbi:MAG: shikimate kinase [Bacilli bacterium]|nr:shikimate kinase [Bacilli bacterium]MDD4063367.1 shikimate kinase [Bacilli bacterium]
MYGLLGKNISYSYSPDVHSKFGGYEYKFYDILEDNFKTFITEKDFKGINVTIPYKEIVIKYLDNLSEEVIKTNSCNTIINKSGKLYGYNTDYYGFKTLLQENKVVVYNKNCLILGSGATSRTVKAVLEDLYASSIIIASRDSLKGDITYSKITEKLQPNIIINTTPVGVSPDYRNSVIDISIFNNLEVVIDVIYNPLRTKLLLDAKEKGIKYINGLMMLVFQAKKASELFQNIKIDNAKALKIYKDLQDTLRNIVFIGLPASGKTTVGKYIAKKTNKKLVSIDKILVASEKMSVSEIFAKKGEDYFRKKEVSLIKEYSQKTNQIIDTGGGVVLNDESMELLKANGLLVFLNRDYDKMILRPGKRPLIKNYDDLLKIKNERYDLYLKHADIIITNNYKLKNSISLVYKKISNYE